MKVAQISRANGDWELVERDIPEPGAGQVRVKVEACGICHSDTLVKEASCANSVVAATSRCVSVCSLIMRRSAVSGWYSGTARDSQDTMEFSALSGVHPMIEKYPLDRVAEAYEQMHSGKVRFRVVLTL